MCNTFKNCEGLSQVAFMDGNGMMSRGSSFPASARRMLPAAASGSEQLQHSVFSRHTCCSSPQRLPTRAEMRSCKWHYFLRCLLFDRSAGELHMHSLPNIRTDRWAHVHGDLAASFFCTLLAAARRGEGSAAAALVCDVKPLHWQSLQWRCTINASILQILATTSA